MNSLLQFYFRIPLLVKLVLQAKTLTRDYFSEFIENLKFVFVQLIGSVKSAVSPKQLLRSFEKASENKINFGKQEDIGECHIIFVDTLCKALSKCKINVLGPGLKSLFNGAYREIVWISKNNELTKVNDREVEFCPIIIGTSEGNLFNEWEKNIYSDITGYKRESGNYTQARQEVWIKDLPKVLFFQIKRTFFLEGTNEGIKDFAGIDIPLVLYPDRMLKKNRKLSSKVREECEVLEKERKDLLAELAYYAESSNNNLGGSVKAIINFLLSEKAQEFDINSTNNSKYIECIQNFLINKKQKIEERIRTIEKEIETKYESLNKTEYILHSVLVHEGVPNSGHYFSLVRDLNEKVWRKYNDSSVKIIQEEEVLKIVRGDFNYKSAYCLVYVCADEISESSTGLPYITHEIDYLRNRDPINEYSLYVEDELVYKLNSENAEANHSASSIEREDLVENICFSYYQKMNQTDNYKHTSSNQHFKYIQSFSMYLTTIKNNKYFNYSILDYCSKYLTQNRLKFLDEEVQLSVSKRLRISMMYTDLLEYEKFIEDYLRSLKYIKIGVYILRNIGNLKFDAATRLFYYCFLTENISNKTVYDLLLYIFKLVLLGLIGDLIGYSKEKKILKVVENSDSINLLQVIYKGEIYVKNLEDILSNIETKYGFNFKGDEREIYKEAIIKAKKKELIAEIVSDKIFDDICKFNEEFNSIDYVVFNDNGQSIEHYDMAREIIYLILEKWKKCYDKMKSGKTIELKDFE